MADSEFSEKFIRLVSRQLGQRAIEASANLREDLGVESIDFQNLLAAIEDAFQVTFDESEVGDIETVGELQALVEAARGGK